MLDEASPYRKTRDSHHLAVITIWASQRVVPSELLRPFSVIPFRWWDWHGHGEQFPTTDQISRAVPIAEKAVGADALKTIRENVKQEAPQELICR